MAFKIETKGGDTPHEAGKLLTPHKTPERLPELGEDRRKNSMEGLGGGINIRAKTAEWFT